MSSFSLISLFHRLCSKKVFIKNLRFSADLTALQFEISDRCLKDYRGDHDNWTNKIIATRSPQKMAPKWFSKRSEKKVYLKPRPGPLLFAPERSTQLLGPSERGVVEPIFKHASYHNHIFSFQCLKLCLSCLTCWWFETGLGLSTATLRRAWRGRAPRDQYCKYCFWWQVIIHHGGLILWWFSIWKRRPASGDLWWRMP